MKLRPHAVLAAITAAIVILAVAAGVFSMQKSRPAYDPRSPEAAVQAYAVAVVEGDNDVAAAALDPALECTAADFAESFSPGGSAISILRAEAASDRASVTVEITRYGQSPLDSFTHEESFELERRGSEWLITGEPWPVYDCRWSR